MPHALEPPKEICKVLLSSPHAFQAWQRAEADGRSREGAMADVSVCLFEVVKTLSSRLIEKAVEAHRPIVPVRSLELLFQLFDGEQAISSSAVRRADGLEEPLENDKPTTTSAGTCTKCGPSPTWPSRVCEPEVDDETAQAAEAGLVYAMHAKPVMPPVAGLDGDAPVIVESSPT